MRTSQDYYYEKSCGIKTPEGIARLIRQWKKQYCRSNSKYTCAFFLRCVMYEHAPWDYYVEVHRNNEVPEKVMISESIYMSMELQRIGQPSTYGNVELARIFDFNPKIIV